MSEAEASSTSPASVATLAWLAISLMPATFWKSRVSVPSCEAGGGGVGKRGRGWGRVRSRVVGVPSCAGWVGLGRGEGWDAGQLPACPAGRGGGAQVVCGAHRGWRSGAGGVAGWTLGACVGGGGKGEGVANESVLQALREVSAVVVGPPHLAGVHEIGVPLPPKPPQPASTPTKTMPSPTPPYPPPPAPTCLAPPTWHHPPGTISTHQAPPAPTHPTTTTHLVPPPPPTWQACMVFTCSISSSRIAEKTS